jgi:hypothetical protein
VQAFRRATEDPSHRGGLAGMFFEEVKRTEGSHDEKNRPHSPPVNLSPVAGVFHRGPGFLGGQGVAFLQEFD